MSFKENILKKIKIDKMAQTVIDSIKPLESGLKVDKETMRCLLEMSPYTLRKERDLDLYVPEVEDSVKKILVLDNELPIYRTTVEDVVLRKSPTIKEMLSIRNAIKILNDTGVVVTKKAESVKAIQDECINTIDLSFTESDLEEIEKDGSASLERGYAEGVIESLSIFAELLGYRHPPKVFKISHHEIIGALTKEKSGEMMFGPIVIYSIIHNLIKFVNEQIGSFNKEKIESMHNIATGKEKASKEGPSVFQYLKEAVVKQKGEKP